MVAVVVLAVAMPFEAIPPLASTPLGALSDIKLVLIFAGIAWLSLGRQALPTSAEWRALTSSLAFLVVAAASALLAPDFADESLRFVLRLTPALLVMLMALRLANTATLVWAVVLGAGASAMLGFAEALRLPAVEPLLGLFKVAPTRVGGELRVSASFQYATIASMYFEMAVPLAIGLYAVAASWRWRAVALFVALACTANVVLSLTRAGMLTVAIVLSVTLVAAMLVRAWRPLLVPALASAAVLVGGVGLLLLRDPVFDLRLVTESDADWYGAVYSAPPSLRVQAAQPASVALDIRNTGRITWSISGSHPFALGYRWLTADGTQVLQVPPGEVVLTRPVQPGDTIHVDARVPVPDLPAGVYRLDWGMLQRDVLEFYERGSPTADTEVQVLRPTFTSTSAEMPETSPRDDALAPWVVGRLDLWGAALQIAAQRPLIGAGPDNFRHLYGVLLGLETWDERVQANNLYLELLADIGVVGLAAFLVILIRPLVTTVGLLRAQSPDFVRAGAGLSLIAFLVHGTLDAFLAFTSTALLFWLVLGVLSAQKPQVSGRWYASNR